MTPIQSNFQDTIEKALRYLELSPLEIDYSTLERFQEYLYLANARMNLTRIPPESSLLLHFVDSLAALRLLSEVRPKHLLDIGSGAGFPGIPLHLALCSPKTTLLDSSLRKVDFLLAASGRLGFQGVFPLHERLEDLALDPSWRESVDLATMRAVGSVEELLPKIRPILQIGGNCLFFRTSLEGSENKHEGFCTEAVDTFSLGSAGPVRSLILYRRTS